MSAKPVGAWYFPGWKDKPSWMPVVWDSRRWDSLKAGYQERKPLIGWYDEGDQAVVRGIMRTLCSAGVDFLAIDWFWDSKTRTSPGDHVLQFLRAEAKGGMPFAIAWDSDIAEVAVQSAADLNDIGDAWGNVMESPNYFTVDGRPVVWVIKLSHAEQVVAKAAGMSHASMLDVFRSRSGKNIYFIACSAAHPHWLWRADIAGYDGYSMYNMTVPTPRIGAQGPFPDPVTFVEMVKNYDIEMRWLLAALPSTLKLWLPMTVGFDPSPIGGAAVGVADPEELGDHFRSGAETIRSSDKVRGGVVYAVNEHSEGGVLLPTQAHGREILGVYERYFGHRE